MTERAVCTGSEGWSVFHSTGYFGNTDRDDGRYPPRPKPPAGMPMTSLTRLGHGTEAWGQSWPRAEDRVHGASTSRALLDGVLRAPVPSGGWCCGRHWPRGRLHFQVVVVSVYTCVRAYVCVYPRVHSFIVCTHLCTCLSADTSVHMGTLQGVGVYRHVAL